MDFGGSGNGSENSYSANRNHLWILVDLDMVQKSPTGPTMDFGGSGSGIRNPNRVDHTHPWILVDLGMV